MRNESQSSMSLMFNGYVLGIYERVFVYECVCEGVCMCVRMHVHVSVCERCMCSGMDLKHHVNV